MIKDIVFDAVKIIIARTDVALAKTVNESTALFEVLDSMDILNLILEIEDKLQKACGRHIQIADETIMDAGKTPFKTISNLITFLEAKVQ